MYILKVWICTCLIAPLIVFLELSGLSALYLNSEDLIIYLFFVGLSLLFSVPTFIVLSLITIFYSGLLNIKFVLNIIGVLGTFISFYVFDNSIFERSFVNDFQGVFWVLAYSGSISFFIWFFKIDKAKHIS